MLISAKDKFQIFCLYIEVIPKCVILRESLQVMVTNILTCVFIESRNWQHWPLLTVLTNVENNKGSSH